MSSFNGHVNTVNMLLSHGADIHVKDKVSKIIIYCYTGAMLIT